MEHKGINVGNLETQSKCEGLHSMKSTLMKLAISIFAVFLLVGNREVQAFNPTYVFTTCAELLATYPSGVAKNSVTAKKTGAVVNAKVYASYKGPLDGNRNGAICEQFGGLSASCVPAADGLSRFDWYGPPNLLTCVKNKKTGRAAFIKALPGSFDNWHCLTMPSVSMESCKRGIPVSNSFKFSWGVISIQQVSAPAVNACVSVPVTIDIRGPQELFQVYLVDEYKNTLSVIDYESLDTEIGVKQYSMQVCGSNWIASDKTLFGNIEAKPVVWCKAYIWAADEGTTSLFTQFTGACRNA